MAKRKIYLKMKDGSASPEKIEVTTFTHYVGNIAYKFALHKDVFGFYTVTHLDSGSSVGKLAVGKSSPADAAKIIETLIFRHGVDRVRVILDSAEKIN